MTGDTEITHFFWRELIMPTPSPSYNGGAVVSFLPTDQTGKFLAGNRFSQMYGFSKWKSPKFRPYNTTHSQYDTEQRLQRRWAGSWLRSARTYAGKHELGDKP